MKKLKILLFVVLVLSLSVFALASCGGNKHEHVWADATCTMPKTCECGATEGEALGHTYEPVVTAPTCTENGYTTYTCACGDSYKADEIEAKGHSYEARVTAPSCTEDGYTTYTCHCGYSYVGSPVKSEGHNYYKSEVTAPTCTEKGYTTHTCTCGYFYTDNEVEATDHTYEAVVTEPTCTTEGYTTYTCHCGDSYIGDKVPVKHNYNSDGICSCGAATNVVPQEGKGYAFGMLQGNLNKIYYLKGGMSGYYMATTTNIEEALYIYVEQTEGGFYAYCFVNGNKTYINMVVSGTHVNGAYEATATTVYTIDETTKTLIANVSGSDYWFGTRNDNTYTTVGPCKTSYNGFYCVFYYAHTHSYETSVTQPTCTTDGFTSHTCSCGANTIELNSAETFTFTNSGSTTQIKGVEFGYEKNNA